MVVGFPLIIKLPLYYSRKKIVQKELPTISILISLLVIFVRVARFFRVLIDFNIDQNDFLHIFRISHLVIYFLRFFVRITNRGRKVESSKAKPDKTSFLYRGRSKVVTEAKLDQQVSF